MIKVTELIEELKKFPEDTVIYNLEGDDIGVLMFNKAGKSVAHSKHKLKSADKYIVKTWEEFVKENYVTNSNQTINI